jgi:hypothetical protein
MIQYEKKYIYQSFGKPRLAKKRLLEKLGDNFRGLITIITSKPAYGHSVDYISRQYHYILNNGSWLRINSDRMMELVIEHDVKYEHLSLEDCVEQ